jgi:type II secretory pathway component PulK
MKRNFHASNGKPAPGRQGMALLIVVVTFAIIAICAGPITLQILTNRRVAAHRKDQLQAAWLARAGVELACARVLSGRPDYSGETLELLPQSRLRISVNTTKDDTARLTVTCEAFFPSDAGPGVVRSVTRQFRKDVDAKTARLVLIPAK